MDAALSDASAHDAAAPMISPCVVSMAVDTAASLLADRVSNRDDNAGSGDGPDGVFDVGITGSFDGLVLVSVANGQGGSLGAATLAWDTLVGDQPFPASAGGTYSRGSDTPLLGVSVDGTHLVNRTDGSLPPFGPGTHQIKIFANAGSAFRSGQLFRLLLVDGNSLSWGPPIEFSWGRPAIDQMAVDPESTLVDRVGEGDTATHGGGSTDGAFDVEVDGPLDALILIATAPSSPDFAWDTIVGDAPFPQGVSVDPVYQLGSDTWVLGVADQGGPLLNVANGTLPRLNGHHSLQLFASDVYLSVFEPGSSYQASTVQVVGLIGDLIIWGPRISLL